MTKPEWGTKRKCVECGTFFYDMCKETFTCPKCGNTYDKGEFAQAHAKAILKNAKKNKNVDKDMNEEELIETVVGDELFEEEGDTSLDVLEDASELSDDNHDMAEVFDNIGSKRDEE